jgi:hypothetical protein
MGAAIWKRPTLADERVASRERYSWRLESSGIQRVNVRYTVLDLERREDGIYTANSRAVLAPGVTSLPDSSLKTKAGVVGPVFFEDASAFAIAPVGSAGMGRNVFRGPKFWDVDASISKDFALTERFKTTFKLETFNSFNHANYRSLADATTGSTSIISPNFGTACCQTRPVATSTAIVSNGEAYRVIQAVLKLSW